MNVSIALDDPRAQHVPESTFAATVRWSGGEENTTGVVRLVWWTEGKGDRDFEIVAEHELDAVGGEGEAALEFTYPALPYSYSGKVVSIRWGIEAAFRPGKHLELLPLTMGPAGDAIDVRGL